MGWSEINELTSKKVLLVGGTGFIGRHILHRLVGIGANVTVLAPLSTIESNIPKLRECELLEGDITVSKNNQAVRNGRWDVVINVGGFINQGSDEDALSQTAEGHLIHVLKLVSALPDSLTRFVQAGSAVEYGDNPAPHQEGMRERGLNPYAAAKVACTHYLQMLHRSRRFPVVILRPFFVFGHGQDKGKFLPYIIEELSNGRTLSLTQGEQTRDPVKVEDVAEAFLRASVEKGIEGEIINIASGAPITIARLAELVQRKIGKGRVDVGALPYRKGEMMRSEADVTKCKRLLNLNPSADIDGNLDTILAPQR